MEYFKKKIANKELKIAIVGLGYVGLPLAIAFAEQGFRVYGIDLDKNKVGSLRKGKSYIKDITNTELKAVIKKRKLSASTSYSAIKKVDVVIIAVPTPLNESKQPDTKYIEAALESVQPHLHKNMLISLESTTYPGTTREMIVPVVKEIKLKTGKDIFVVFSPERVDPGNKKYKIKNTPRLVGGITKNCTKVGKLVYEVAINEVVPLNTTEEAEMAKLLENTFRLVNITLVNELLMMSERMGIDFWQVIKGASTKPFGFMPFYPGPGIGGHCIPLDPMYLSWKAKQKDYFSRFIELATDINSNMPYYVVSRLRKLLDKQGKALSESSILLLGMAYKKNIDDLRESASLKVYELLTGKVKRLEFFDPLVKSFKNHKGRTISSINTPTRTLRFYDALILLTEHSDFDYKRLAESGKPVLDTKNAFEKYLGQHAFKNIEKF